MSENTKPDGGAAFPVQHENGWTATGMTLHAWYAGMAMQGICAHPDTWGLTISEIAERANEVADAMIAARSKP